MANFELICIADFKLDVCSDTEIDLKFFLQQCFYLDGY